jgi:hypothetical protein
MISIVALLVLFLPAGLLLRRGWIGRTIGDHPVCRRCGFDLFGLPQGSVVCSECGTDLTHKRAVRIGHRERRRGFLIAGLAMMLIAVAIVAVNGVFLYSSANLQAYKPVWWLAREVKSPDAPTRDAALMEFTSRLGAGKLSQSQIDSIAELGLALQADRSKTWVPAWGDWLEAVQAKGMLSSERSQRYLEQALVLEFKLRSEIRRDDRLPYQMNHNNARLGTRTSLYANYQTVACEIDSKKINENFVSGGFTFSTNATGGIGSSIDLKRVMPDLPEGRHNLRATIDLKISRTHNSASFASVKKVLTGKFVTRPPTETPVTLVRDPALRTKVEQSLKISHASFAMWSPSQLSVTVNIDGPPVGVGFDVSAIADGKTFKLGSFACPAGVRGHGWGFGVDAKGFTGGTIDVILKPSVETAMASTDTFEIWDGEVAMRNVKVTGKPPAATTTATMPTTQNKTR